MTRQELIERFQRRTKRVNRWGRIYMISLLAMVVLVGLLCAAVPREMRETVILISFAVSYVTTLGLALSIRLTVRQAGLVCPHCRTLFSGTLGQIVVASGRCGKCGGRIVDEES
jgi:hypothetical protein